MYRAMQKLDEKFESLKAKVMHIEPVQRFQKVNPFVLLLYITLHLLYITYSYT